MTKRGVESLWWRGVADLADGGCGHEASIIWLEVLVGLLWASHRLAVAWSVHRTSWVVEPRGTSWRAWMHGHAVVHATGAEALVKS